MDGQENKPEENNDQGPIDTSSRHKIDDTVVLDFYQCGVISTGTISKISYTNYGKVLYDITIKPFSNEPDNKDHEFILKDIDSYFVKTEAEHLLKTYE